MQGKLRDVQGRMAEDGTMTTIMIIITMTDGKGEIKGKKVRKPL